MSNVAKLKGYIKTSSQLAVANNPLQSRVEIILTDFEPNLNKQGVPLSERDNIMRSALNMPLKINFDGEDFYGHSGAIPLGPIIKVWDDTHNGRSVIKGEAIIWTEHYKDVAEHIKALFDTGVGTSWEIYYADSELDSEGVEWLHDTVFAGTCVVDTPAYGPERTRILAIAEKLGETMGKTEAQSKTEAEAEDVSNVDTNVDTAETNVETDININSEVNDAADTNTDTNTDNAASAEEEGNVREDISEAQTLLFKIYEGLDQLYATTYEIEREQTEANIGTIAEQFADLIEKIATRVTEMRASVAELTSEVTTYRNAEAERKAAAEKADKLNSRRTTLAEAGIVYNDESWNTRVETIYAMSDNTFKLYVDDLAIAKSNKTQAEINNPIIPEPVGSSGAPDIKELGAALKKAFKKG